MRLGFNFGCEQREDSTKVSASVDRWDSVARFAGKLV